ncbi:MAG: tetratricopeptide repeat protein [candidate division Zixibacteria bacterium]|nr:tetratricopeptide repeat protein [Candidatus Tariuqbacter arcticus]
MKFESLEQLKDFCAYVENHTGLYAIDFLGYPWYLVAKEALNNDISQSTAANFSPAHRTARQADFNSKLSLLNRTYDYAFHTKAKMRRKDKNEIENYLFSDIFNYLRERGKSFIIFEEASGEDFDLKYLNAGFSDVTIPFEYLISAFKSSLNPATEQAVLQYRQLVEAVFKDVKVIPQFAELALLLKRKYIEMTGFVPQIILKTNILSRMNVKAIFGGMGTHLTAGLNNPYALVEVGHGYPGAFQPNPPPPKPPLREYQRLHFNLDHLYMLTPSPSGEIHKGEVICLEKNRFNYGMPEIRGYQPSKEKLDSLKEKYNLFNRQVIFIATNGFIDFDLFVKLINSIQVNFPQAKILLRPHPQYEDSTQHRYSGDSIALVKTENKYDLLSLADIVLSVPSSILVEALMFTDNIIAFTDDNYRSAESRDLLKKRYPFASVIPIENTIELIEKIGCFSAHPSKKLPHQHPVDYKTELDKLFTRIEGESTRTLEAAGENEVEILIDSGLNPEIINLKGEQLFQSGDIDGALKAFTEAAALKPECASAYNNIGVVHWNRGNTEEAMIWFENAYKINPADKNTVMNYAGACAAQKKFDLVKDILEDFAKRFPEDYEIQTTLKSVM